MKRILLALLLTASCLAQDLQKARELYQASKLPEALEELNKAPASPMTYRLRGLVYHQLEGTPEQKRTNWALSLKDYDKAITLDPKFADAYFGRGNLQADIGQALKEKLNWLEEHNLHLGICKDPLIVDARGKSRKEVLDLAIADYDQAIALEKKYTYYFMRGSAYQFEKNWTAAIADMEESSRLNPQFQTGNDTARALKSLMKL